MTILFRVMQASLMLSKTISAVGAVIVIGYGIHQFVKDRKSTRKKALTHQ